MFETESSSKVTKMVVARTVMLAFILFWKAAWRKVS